MKSKLCAVLLIMLTATVATMTTVGYQKIIDDDAYNRIVIIKGHLEIVNDREVIAGGHYLVFRRVGCKDCLVATRSDEHGNYQIFVGQGRYEVLSYNPSPPTYDLMAPEQKRFIDATPGVEATVFNIKLKFSNE